LSRFSSALRFRRPWPPRHHPPTGRKSALRSLQEPSASSLSSAEKTLADAFDRPAVVSPDCNVVGMQQRLCCETSDQRKLHGQRNCNPIRQCRLRPDDFNNCYRELEMHCRICAKRLYAVSSNSWQRCCFPIVGVYQVFASDFLEAGVELIGSPAPECYNRDLPGERWRQGRVRTHAGARISS